MLFSALIGDKAGGDARLTIDDEFYNTLDITKFQRAIVDQCDSVSSETNEKKMTFGLPVLLRRPIHVFSLEGPRNRPRRRLLQPAVPGLFRLRCGVSSGIGPGQHLKNTKYNKFPWHKIPTYDVSPLHRYTSRNSVATRSG